MVDMTLPNFNGLRLLVRCTPGDGADFGESEDLCNNMQTLYSNQGAKVEIEIPPEPSENGENTENAGGGEPPPERSGLKPDLIIDLKARKVHSENSPLLWVLCIASATLIPAITEATYAQDVVIRDPEGFLLVQDSLQARFIRYFGLAFWGVNGLLDLFVRPKGEGLIGTNHQKDFSKDFQGQLSQLAFHAWMRSKILRAFEQETVSAPAPVPTSAPAPGPAPAQKAPASKLSDSPPPPPPPPPPPSPAPSRRPP
jgi:hypothetical protein